MTHNSELSPNPFTQKQQATQGLLPDFQYEKQRALRSLGDVKCISVCPSRYGRPRMADNKRCGAVAERQRLVPLETRRAARKVDRKRNGTQQGVKGPVETELESYGVVEGLVFGAYGEVSEHVDQLMLAAAGKAAGVHWRTMGAQNVADAKSAYVTRFRDWLGIEGVRSHAKMKADRLREVLAARVNPPGAVAQAEERRRATERECRLRRAQYHAFHLGTGAGSGRPW